MKQVTLCWQTLTVQLKRRRKQTRCKCFQLMRWYTACRLTSATLQTTRTPVTYSSRTRISTCNTAKAFVARYINLFWGLLKLDTASCCLCRFWCTSTSQRQRKHRHVLVFIQFRGLVDASEGRVECDVTFAGYN